MGWDGIGAGVYDVFGKPRAGFLARNTALHYASFED